MKSNEEISVRELEKFKVNMRALTKVINSELRNNLDGNALLRNYDKKSMLELLEAPASNADELRNLNLLMYNLSPHYKRILHYFIDMTRFDYVVDVSKLEGLSRTPSVLHQKYLETIETLDKYNLKHEFHKMTATAFMEDVFYGYDYETSDSYVVQKLDPGYCRLKPGYVDSVRTFEFDFSFFNGKRKALLDEGYDPEFKQKYEIYDNDRKNRWQELDPARTYCIKLSDEVDYAVPFFSSLFPDIFDIHDYKLLKKAKVELENYVVLFAKIPYLKNNDIANAFALHGDDAEEYGNEIAMMLPDQVGFAVSPFDNVDAVYLSDKSAKAEDSVERAEKSLFSSAGVSEALFSSDNISEESIRKSIKADENVIFGLYRQLERNINKKIKLNHDESFKVRIMNTTEFNYLEVSRYLSECAMYGVPVKRELCAVLGQTPMEMESSLNLESVLNLEERFVPLKSSNTMSPDKEGGRPTKDATGADSGGAKAEDE